ncbi:MAG: MBL fold metallo-hydrolase [Firmicutes bacterium]|nr:MBL fold metallo-hydrolase [Bacillota bacterium]
MIFKQFILGPMGANCYLIGCEETRAAAVIDPGGEPSEVLAEIKRLGLTLRCVINTHGHVDHIAGNRAVKEATGAEILIHAADAPMLTNSRLNLSSFLEDEAGLLAGPPADRELLDDEVIEVGHLSIQVRHTPGHTPGGICLLAGDALFSGDTLFAESIGRTDFPGGSAETLIRSIQQKLLVLPDETPVYPGHGPMTTIGDEKALNPFL